MMRAMNLASRAPWAALVLPALLAACSSSAQPPSLGTENNKKDGAAYDSGGDSTVGIMPMMGDAGDSGADASAESSLEASTDDVSPEATGPIGEPLDGGVEAEAAAGPPPSCATAGPGVSDCKSDGGSCCTSQEVDPGQFFRGYDGVSTGDMSKFYPAAVGAFRLDQYEITVGRFRRFVAAEVAGYLPAAASGKHAHLNGGLGLADSSAQGKYEGGWDSSWNSNLATTVDDWNKNLACDATSATWTPAAGTGEDLPVNCVTWFEAYAFCIWDGGFLPSEAEWNYAASGGNEQRVYPWSSPPTSTTIDCGHANYMGDADASTDSGPGDCVMPGAANAVGSESPAGDGKWGQSDLAGNVLEWNLDYFAPYVGTCPECAWLTSTSVRSARGGAYNEQASYLLSSARDAYDPGTRVGYLGVRCARAP